MIALELGRANPSNYLREQIGGFLDELEREAHDRYVDRFIDEHGFAPIGGGASFSDYLENKVIDHVRGKTSFTMPATPFLALCTVVPTDSSTGSTITEASYTGYARKSVAGSDLNAASSGSGDNVNAITFAACTAGSSTIIGWAYCDASTVGNILFWGTCTSTVISTTQTPATIPANSLILTLD